MGIEHYDISIETDGSGDGVGYFPRVEGRILTVMYAKDGTAPYAATADFTITTEATAQNVWSETDINASKTVCPRQPTHDYQGVASLYAAAGEPVEDYIYAANERVKVVVAQGGDTKVGKFTLIIG